MSEARARAALDSLAAGPWLAAAALFLAGAVVIGIGVLLLETFLGDPGIYLPYARNAAGGDPFSFNPQEFSSGSTSPLWPLLLAPAYGTGAGATGAKVISLLVSLGALTLTVVAAYRASAHLLVAAIASFLAVPLIGQFGAVMYETPLTTGLVALSVVVGDRVARDRAREAGPPSAKDLAPLAAVWAMLPLARPEAAGLVALHVLALGITGPFRDRRVLGRLIAAAALAALPALAYYGYSELTLGTPSTSSQGRSFAWREFSGRLGPFYLSLDAVKYVLSPPFVFGFLFGTVGLAFMARGRRLRWLGLYGLGGIAMYLVLLTFVSPAGYDTRRYFVPVVPLIAVGLAWGLAHIGHGRRRLPALGLALALVVAPAVLTAATETRTLRQRDYSLDQIMEREAARNVNRLARPGDTALAYEVQVRYFIRPDVQVLSLDGVTDGKVHPYQASADMAAFLRRYKPRFWIASDATGASARPYLRRSILETVIRRFKAEPELREIRVAGIGFRLAAVRQSPMPAIFGGWTRVFELTY